MGGGGVGGWGGGGGYNDIKKRANKKVLWDGIILCMSYLSPWEGVLERPHHFKPEIIVRKADNWQVEFLITYLCNIEIIRLVVFSNMRWN